MTPDLLVSTPRYPEEVEKREEEEEEDCDDACEDKEGGDGPS
jgi:hypothetical protein